MTHTYNFDINENILLVNEAGLLIFTYTQWLSASNKEKVPFHKSIAGRNFSENKMLSLISDRYSYDESYRDFVMTVKKESFPHLESFFKNDNQDILTLAGIYEANDPDYFPFLTGIFQNITVSSIEDFAYEDFKKLYNIFFYKLIGVDFSDKEFSDVDSYEDFIARAENIDLLPLLAKTSFTDRETMELVRFFTNTKDLFDRLYPLVKILCEIMEDNFDLISDLFREKTEALEDNSNKVIGELFDQVGVSDFFQKRKRPTEVYTLIFAPQTSMIQFYSYDLIESFVKIGMYFSLSKEEGDSLKYHSQILKVLGDDTRIDILDLLKEDNYYAKELSDKLFITPATLSYHLNQLQICGFVGSYMVGRKTYYYLRKAGFDNVIDSLTDFAKDLKEENNERKS